MKRFVVSMVVLMLAQVTMGYHFKSIKYARQPSKGQPPMSNGQLPVSNGQLPVSNGQLPASNGQLPASNGQLPASNGQLPASNGQLPASNGQLPASNGQLPASNGQLPASNGQLPASNGQLPASNGQLPASDEAEPPAASNEAEPPAASNEAEQPAASDEAEQPAASDEAEQPAASDEAEQPAASDEAEQPAASDEAEQPAASDEAEQPAASDEAEQPAASDEADDQTPSVPLYSGLSDDELEQFADRTSGACGSYLTLSATEDVVTINTNSLPDHEWGCVNPNKPSEQEVTYSLPRNPEFDSNGPYCLSPGTIAVGINGVPFYNPLTSEGLNAVTGSSEEEFDCCIGHATNTGAYHYHKLPVSSSCNNPIFNVNDQSEPQLIGVALDGFPIYGQWDSLDTSSLDECHGTTLPDGRYAYVAVEEHFPYIMGCYKGTPSNGNRQYTSCPGMATGKVCDCNWGVSTEAEVTTYDKKRTQAAADAEENVAEMLIRLLKDLSSGRYKRSARFSPRFYFMKRAELGDCYSDVCGFSDMEYSNEQCSGGSAPAGQAPSGQKPPPGKK